MESQWKFQGGGGVSKAKILKQGPKLTFLCWRQLATEGDMGVCGVAVLLIFLCGVVVNKIPPCGVAVISNPAVCGLCF